MDIKEILPRVYYPVSDWGKAEVHTPDCICGICSAEKMTVKILVTEEMLRAGIQAAAAAPSPAWSDMTPAIYRAMAAKDSDMRAQRDAAISAGEAYVYLRNLVVLCAPQCAPMPDLMGLCTQIDNLVAGGRAGHRALMEERDAALARAENAIKERNLLMEHRDAANATMAEALEYRDAALARAEAAERLAGSATSMKSQRIAALEAENTHLRERDSSFHRAIKRAATVFVLCLGLSVPAMAQQSQPYEPTVTVLARQAQLCEQVASREIARVTEENAALKKQIEDAKGKP